MPVEIEAKFRLPDPETLRPLLTAAGARRLRAVLEHNTYFDTPDESLRKSDRGLRIRRIEADDGSRRTELTYKGPRRPGEVKVRQEEEIVIPSAEPAAAILAGLGYRPGVRFQKRRESFQLGGARVELDELPELGFFLEIEAADERTVQAVRRKLGLENVRTVTAPYVALVADHLAAGPERTRGELKF